MSRRRSHCPRSPRTATTSALLPHLRQRGLALCGLAALLLASCDDGLEPPPEWEMLDAAVSTTIEIVPADEVSISPSGLGVADAEALAVEAKPPAAQPDRAHDRHASRPSPEMVRPPEAAAAPAVATARLAATAPAAAATSTSSRVVVAEPAAAAAPLVPRVYQTQPIRGPRIGGSDRNHDFGTVTIGTELRHTFVIRNAGDRTLRILRATPTLGLARVKFDRELEPGAEGKLEVVLATARMNPGRAMLSIMLETSDRRSDVTFVLSGTVELPHGSQGAQPAAAMSASR